MNKILTIVKKELKRYFTDKRTLISLFLPGILIFIIYSVMGNIMSSQYSTDNHLFSVYTESMPDAYKNIFDGFDSKVNIKENEVGSSVGLDAVKNGEVDLFIKFDSDFSEKLANGEQPNVEVFYSSDTQASVMLYSYTMEKLGETAYNVTVNYLINASPDTAYDVNVPEEEDSSRMYLQMMMPFLLIIFLFSGCMAISSEAIAGEKERGTIYTLLVTPTKRSEIAIGKILALSIVSLVSASVSFVGTIISLPKLMGGDANISLAIYNFTDYLAIFLIILVTVIFFTSVLLLISSYAKSVKEAGQLALVVMIPTMIVGVTSMLGTNDKVWASFIPIYNSITTMSGVFAGNINILNFILTIVTNIVIVGIIVYLLTKMFNSEKIMRSN